MTFEDSIPVAKQLAENQLAKSFDVQAFLILSNIKLMTRQDIIGTEVDDKIEYMYSLFTMYIETHNTEILREFLDTNYKMLSELFHIISTQSEKEIFNNYINSISNIKGSQ